VPAAYRTLVREQTGIGPVEPLAPLDAPEGFHVAIIGAGVTGVLAARTLHGLGVTNITVLEKNAEPGGTWWQNTYPGCRVDTPSLLYSFSFDKDPDWPEHFSRQPELLNYVKRLASESELGERLWCGTEVTAMTWNEDDACWHIELSHADGSNSSITAHAGRRARPVARGQVPRHPRPRRLCPTDHALGALGPRREPRRQAGRDHRHWCQRQPDRAGDRARRRRGRHLPAKPALDHFASEVRQDARRRRKAGVRRSRLCREWNRFSWGRGSSAA
jgi:4-hydroxyacetophenone monooxygenase